MSRGFWFVETQGLVRQWDPSFNDAEPAVDWTASVPLGFDFNQAVHDEVDAHAS